MPASTLPRTKRDFAWVIQDEGAEHSLSPAIQPGNFAYEAPLYDLVQIRNIGELVVARKGDEQPMTLSFGTILTDVGSDTYATIPDLCEERGYVDANWTSTTVSDVDTYDLVGVMDGSISGEADKEMTFPDIVFRGSASIEYPGTYDVTGVSVTASKPTVADS